MAGLGGIGSWVFLTLHRMGFKNLSGADFDTVELANVGTQCYRVEDLRRRKTDAILHQALKIHKMSFPMIFDVNLFEFEFSKFRNDAITVMAVDDMDLRKHLVKNSHEWIIDGRMGAEEAQIRTFNKKNKKDLKAWNVSWFPNEDAEEVPCTQRATAYTGMLCAARIVSIIKEIITKNGKDIAYFTDWGIED